MKNNTINNVTRLTLNERLELEKRRQQQTITTNKTKKDDKGIKFADVLKNVLGIVVVGALLGSMFVWGLDQSPLTQKAKTETISINIGGTK